MAKIRIQKNVLSKEDFDKSVDRSFKTFVNEQVEEETDSIQELFRLYDKFYYEIPTEGDELSHEFLIRESSKLQPLLDEISELRQRILEQQQAAIEEIEDITQLDGTS